MHFTPREWTRMSTAPTEAAVEHAKSQLKVTLLLILDVTSTIAEDIGRQVVTSGRRFTPKEVENAVEVVSVDEIKQVAQRYPWGKDVSVFLFFRSATDTLNVCACCDRSC